MCLLLKSWKIRLLAWFLQIIRFAPKPFDTSRFCDGTYWLTRGLLSQTSYSNFSTTRTMWHIFNCLTVFDLIRGSSKHRNSQNVIKPIFLRYLGMLISLAASFLVLQSRLGKNIPAARGGWEEEKLKRAGKAAWEGERKKGGLCQILCGSLAGFVVLWFWLNQTTIWTVLNVLSKI